MTVFRTAVAVLLLAAVAANAQSFMNGGNFSRLERKGDLRLIIGSETGRHYFRIQNIGGTPQATKIIVVRFANVETGERSSSVTRVALGPYEVRDRVWADEIAPAPSWVERWELADILPGEETAAPPLDREAEPFLRVPPSYPAYCMAAAAPYEAVQVRYIVSETGEIVNSRVLESTNPCLDGAALSALQQWSYAPQIENGRPVKRTYMETQFTFLLEE